MKFVFKYVVLIFKAAHAFQQKIYNYSEPPTFDAHHRGLQQDTSENYACSSFQNTVVGIASSDDGIRLVATSSSYYEAGFLHTSSDAGATWIERNSIGPQIWARYWGVTSSSDGKVIAAVTTNGDFFLSKNGGESWNNMAGVFVYPSPVPTPRPTAYPTRGPTLQPTFAPSTLPTLPSSEVPTAPPTKSPTRNPSKYPTAFPTVYPTRSPTFSSVTIPWVSVASSANCTYLIAAEKYLWISSDAGSTFTVMIEMGSRPWKGVACSSDGRRFIAAEYALWISSNYGLDWTMVSGTANKYWGPVASSSDGMRLAASPSADNWAYAYIWTSSDGGLTWTEQKSSSSQHWLSIASSSDGLKLAAVAESRLMISSNGGRNWTESNIGGNDDFDFFWYAIASSSDGMRLAVANYHTFPLVYTSIDGGDDWATTYCQCPYPQISFGADNPQGCFGVNLSLSNLAVLIVVVSFLVTFCGLLTLYRNGERMCAVAFVTILPFLDFASDTFYLANTSFYSEFLFRTSLSLYAFSLAFPFFYFLCRRGKTSNLLQRFFLPSLNVSCIDLDVDLGLVIVIGGRKTPVSIFRENNNIIKLLVYVISSIVVLILQVLCFILYHGMYWVLYALLLLPYLPWLLLGMLFYQFKIMGIRAVSDLWLWIYTGRSESITADELDIRMLNESLLLECICESLPQFILQLVNSLITKNLTPVFFFSAGVSVFVCVNCLYYYGYYICIQGKSLDEIVFSVGFSGLVPDAPKENVVYMPPNSLTTPLLQDETGVVDGEVSISEPYSVNRALPPTVRNDCPQYAVVHERNDRSLDSLDSAINLIQLELLDVKSMLNREMSGVELELSAIKLKLSAMENKLQ